ncbi:hypothetical protein ACWDYH_08750 [Nocardia goodfellowii]
MLVGEGFDLATEAVGEGRVDHDRELAGRIGQPLLVHRHPQQPRILIAGQAIDTARAGRVLLGLGVTGRIPHLDRRQHRHNLAGLVEELDRVAIDLRCQLTGRELENPETLPHSRFRLQDDRFFDLTGGDLIGQIRVGESIGVGDGRTVDLARGLLRALQLQGDRRAVRAHPQQRRIIGVLGKIDRDITARGGDPLGVLRLDQAGIDPLPATAEIADIDRPLRQQHCFGAVAVGGLDRFLAISVLGLAA